MPRFYGRIKPHLNSGKPVRELEFTPEELKIVKGRWS